MSLSKKNKAITIKVNNDTFEFLQNYCKKFNVSVSSFCQDCVVQSILYHDKTAHDTTLYSSPDVYYRKLAWFISNTYDERKK